MISEIFSIQNPWRKEAHYSFELKDRNILNVLIRNMDNELIIGLIGSRQVGKSSILYLLIERLLKGKVNPLNIFYFNLDDLKLHELFTTVPDFLQFLGDDKEQKYVFIDEIQRLDSPGLFLKEVFDLKRKIKIIYSGSSQLEIKAKTREHLVGRARIFQINRLSFSEYLEFASPITKMDALQQIMIYGSYPSVAKETDSFEKKLRLRDIYQSYIQKDLKDFLQLEKIDGFNKLLVQLANQTGDLLNIHSLSNSLAISRIEVERLINILEYTFICSKIYPFYKNYSKEITKTPKIYFLDSGLRNYVLNNFQPFSKRNDIGKLFENFYYIEMIANDFYNFNKINFWRTTNQTEIDFIVQNENGTEAIEIKWEKQQAPKSFKTIREYYPEIQTRVVTHKEFTGH
ncbi:MAG TPA: ATP-binding protein [Draconibacterium sp.]|nr:ATP-binding protein [Draconibacterium sp.]